MKELAPTVRNFIQHIYTKLAIGNKAELVALFAKREGAPKERKVKAHSF